MKQQVADCFDMNNPKDFISKAFLDFKLPIRKGAIYNQTTMTSEFYNNKSVKFV